MIKKKKIIVILGMTASGKTGLGVKLAGEYNGEIVSADSRQVYKGMDVGTGKDLDEYYQKTDLKRIPCHLIDIIEPNEEFSLAEFQKLAFKAIDNILDRGKLPIIVGGSGLYLQAIVDGYDLSHPGSDKAKRKELGVKTVDELFSELKKLNHSFANKLNDSDSKNKRRLIRYLEMSGSEINPGFKKKRSNEKHFDALLIGLTWPKEVLHKRIYKRLIERLEKEDMIGEVDRLHENGVAWKRLEDFGLEYKFIAYYLQEKMDYEEMVENLYTAIKKFAKRQLTWLRRWEKQGAKIHWIEDQKKVAKIIDNFLRS